ncbi:WYL domain-containing protein [Helicobacter canis]|uniref:WYL domain-containing protein n=2 Tax=Helicobacter canis TaxID=29419 RepID=A0A5M9QHW7_9HELI|nr:WYL domain-containing protein [Helicobacter canis]
MVRLWIDPKIAKYFKRKKISPNQHLDENTDGSLDITLHITSAMEIAPLVLMWIPNVVVLEPKDLREFIQAQTQSYVQRVQEIS